MYLLGTSLYNLEKFSEAIEAFKNVIKAYSQDTELVQKAEYEIADCFYQMGNEKEAMERFKSLRAKYPDSSLTPEVMWWLGEYHYRHNELAVARRYFSSLVQDFPQSSLIADAYYALGSISQEEGKFEEAKQDFKKVMTLSKSDFAGTAAIAIADMQVRQGLTNQALEMYKEILTNYAHLAYLVYPKMADIYQEIGRHEEALDLYHKTMAIAPSRQAATIQFKIGEIKEAQGKKKEAIEEYLKVTYLYPQDNSLTVKALLRIASLYEAQEDFMQAQAAYEKIAVMNVEE